MDTIFARSTAPGRAGIAVVRISGPDAWAAVRELVCGRLPPERRASLRKIWDGQTLLDQAVVLLFGEGRSFTGEESAELHLHGSEAVVRAVLATLGNKPGLRPASAGEFTRRALENDRLSLAEVEGLGALLSAETEAQRRLAMQVVSGRLREAAERWRGTLLSALAEIEVTIDFADEEVPEAVPEGLPATLRDLARELELERRGVAAAGQIARGFEVAIVGAPNTGKSTLLNRLAGRDAAITSEVAGTTRDVVEVRMEVGGHLVTWLDTAGIRETDDTVEKIGVTRARERAEAADVRVFLDAVPEGMAAQEGDITVISKADLRSGGGSARISGKTGEGVDALLGHVAATLEARVGSAGLAITERQSSALARARDALSEAAAMLEAQTDRPELASGLVRSAVLALEEMIGRVGVEEVLGEVFAGFCIGK